MALRAVARVNLAAIERNCTRLRAELDAGSTLCAVVKANGYGHGAVASARAALAGGARWLAVATALEAAELRAAAIETQVLVMGALSAEELPIALAAQADVSVWSEQLVAALRRSGGRGIRVHLKLDVGMGRLGTRDADALLRLAEQVLAAPELKLVGAMSHLPCADKDAELTRAQVADFAAFGERLRTLAPDVLLHTANSAATLSLPESHFDLVRCGVAIYGLDPFGVDAAARGLEPALELSSYVAACKALAVGQSVGYGSCFTAREPTWIATLPIGYGDGVRRAFAAHGEVLIGGRRHPLAGRVSMDNVTVDVGPAPDVQVGDAAILLGADGEQRLTAEQLARASCTINYEITTALTARVTRAYHHDGVAAA